MTELTRGEKIRQTMHSFGHGLDPVEVGKMGALKRWRKV